MAKNKPIEVEGRYISVKAAEPFGHQVIDPVIITISGHYSSERKKDIAQLPDAFKADAKKLFDGLRSIPGGTFDQLLILMLQKSASSFIVPHNFHDGEPPQFSFSMLDLLEKALPIIEEEAERREFIKPERHGESNQLTTAEYGYYTEMRALANEFSAEIDRARDCKKGKGASDVV